MPSHPAAPIGDDDPSDESMRIARRRHKDDPSPNGESTETENDALRSFRERLKRSPHRPRWWADHMRSLFR